MKVGISIFSLEEKAIKKLKALVKPHQYTSHGQLFYKGQTPIVAYLVLEGEIHLQKGQKPVTIIGPGSVIGLKELLSHSRITCSAEVFAETKVLFLDKSTVKEILNKNPPELRGLFEKIPA